MATDGPANRPCSAPARQKRRRNPACTMARRGCAGGRPLAELRLRADPPRPSRHARPRRRPARADVLAIGAYVLLGVFVCLNYWGDVNNRVSSHLPTDHSWFEWLFAHGAYSVRHLENPLFTARQNAPDGVNMMANTSLLGVTLPLAPLTMLLGPQVMYALYLGGALAATAGTSYWMLSRHLVRSRAAAFVGGAFLGFAPGIVHHANGQPELRLQLPAAADRGAGVPARRAGPVAAQRARARAAGGVPDLHQRGDAAAHRAGLPGRRDRVRGACGRHGRAARGRHLRRPRSASAAGWRCC